MHRTTSTMEELEVKCDNYFQENGYYGTDDVACLLMGAPGKHVLRRCAEYLQKASIHRLGEEKCEGNMFQYGPSMGDWKFRVNLATFLSNRYQEKVQMQNLMVTAGASHGLYLTASLLLNEGSIVFVEDPTYFIAIHVLKTDLKMNVVPVPMDEYGIKIEAMVDILKHASESDKNESPKSAFKAMIYTIPAYQNPTGLCYSEGRSQELVQFVKDHNLLLFCDDVYNLLEYKKLKPPRPLVFYDDLYEGHVISNGTFSKIMGPGLRLGWIQASRSILDLFRKSSVIRSGGNVNNYMSGIMSSVLELGLQTQHLNYLQRIYGSAMSKVCKILRDQLPKECSFSEPEGGYFVWVTLPSSTKSEEFVTWAKENYKVFPQAGNRCSVKGNFENCIRIAVSFYEEAELLDAVQRLCQALNSFLKRQ